MAGDHDELARIAENLIENAIKYGASETGGEIDIAVVATDRDGVLSVRDHGPGIAPEHLPRLTERFYRVDIGASRAKGGTGLGLALVKHIVARHRGRLIIEFELSARAPVSRSKSRYTGTNSRILTLYFNKLVLSKIDIFLL